MVRFLIDECLSPTLVDQANTYGYECHAVTRLGMGGWQDWQLAPIIEREGYTLVTNDSVDFRKKFSQMELHGGLICLNGSGAQRLTIPLLQRAFDVAIALLKENGDELMNQVIEVSLDPSTDPPSFMVELYDLPEPSAKPVDTQMGLDEEAPRTFPTKH